MKNSQETIQEDHHCIIQQSSNLILTIGETAQEAVTEYNNTFQEEKSVNDFSSSFYSNDDVVLLPCTKFLHSKVLLIGGDIHYFYNGFEIDAYIETVEDFDKADTMLSSEYDEGSPHHTYLDTSAVSLPYFNLKESLIETALKYETGLTYDEISDIALSLEVHFEDEKTQDFDQVKYVLCTNSNEQETHEIFYDEQEDEFYYVLAFSNNDLVLYLTK